MSDENITLLILRIQAGRDEDAAAELWDAYFSRVASVARKRLMNTPKRMADEEDIAISALQSFFQAIELGKLDALNNRDALWRVLVTITIRKASHYTKMATAKKRGGQLVRGESAFVKRRAGDPENLAGIPDQRTVHELISECRDRIESLPEEFLQQIAVMRLHGWSTQEIALKSGVSHSTIKRKVRRIREIWTASDQELTPP